MTLEALRLIGILVQPVMPASASTLLDLLGVAASARNFNFVSAEYAVAASTELPPPTPIFPRYIEPVLDEKAPSLS